MFKTNHIWNHTVSTDFWSWGQRSAGVLPEVLGAHTWAGAISGPPWRFQQVWFVFENKKQQQKECVCLTWGVKLFQHNPEMRTVKTQTFFDLWNTFFSHLLTFLNKCLITLLHCNTSVLFTRQCRVRRCRSRTACSHKSAVSSSTSSPGSSPTTPVSSPWVEAGTPRRWPPGCATASACRSSCSLSRQKYTGTPQSGHTPPRGWGRRPSVSMTAGSSVAAAPLYTPVGTRAAAFNR